jgi:hypothetical protein
MAERKPFLLRADPAILEAYQRWAAQELRSVNAQLEFVLRRVLLQEGRLSGTEGPKESPPPEGGSEIQS